MRLQLESSSYHRNVHTDARIGIFGPSNRSFGTGISSPNVAHVQQSSAYSEAVTENNLSVYYLDAPITYGVVRCSHASLGEARLQLPTSSTEPKPGQIASLTYEGEAVHWHIESVTNEGVNNSLWMFQALGPKVLLEEDATYTIFVRNSVPAVSTHVSTSDLVDIQAVKIERTSIDLSHVSVDSELTERLFTLTADIHVDAGDIWTVFLPSASLPFSLSVRNVVIRLRKTVVDTVVVELLKPDHTTRLTFGPGENTLAFGLHTTTIDPRPTDNFSLRFSDACAVEGLVTICPSFQTNGSYVTMPMTTGLKFRQFFTGPRPRRCLLYIGGATPQPLQEAQKSVFAVESIDTIHDRLLVFQLSKSTPLTYPGESVLIECWNNARVQQFTLGRQMSRASSAGMVTIGLDYIILPAYLARGLAYAVVHLLFTTGEAVEQYVHSKSNTNPSSERTAARFVCSQTHIVLGARMCKFTALTQQQHVKQVTLPLQVPDVMVTDGDNNVLIGRPGGLLEGLPNASDSIFVGFEVLVTL